MCDVFCITKNSACYYSSYEHGHRDSLLQKIRVDVGRL